MTTQNLYRFKAKSAWMFLVFLWMTAGCAGLSLKRVDVNFENPYQKLGITEREPTEAEKAGVVLRIHAPPGGVLRSREETTLYAQIKNNQGIKLNLVQNRIDQFCPGGRQDSYIMHSETSFEGSDGTILEEVEQTDRGEIVCFLKGLHRSKIGKFQIESWTRTPVFPDGPVKLQDSWEYEEITDVRLDSFWIQQKNPSPYILKATCELIGFASVGGRPAAVIKTHAAQTKEERLKFLFKEFVFTIYADIEERMYLDYSTGTVIAKITTTKSRMMDRHHKIVDTGQSQSLLWITESAQSPGDLKASSSNASSPKSKMP
ncbi:MAG: hypothetical protein NC930_02635 [Candidatus Omnitrophica bacterium]|nr:hypothetical protein [Candidatus Omnitrophota bacterium]